MYEVNTEPVPSTPLEERAADLGTVVPFTDGSFVLITALRVNDEPAAGDVLRRTCMAVGAQACQSFCQIAAFAGRTPEGTLGEGTVEALQGCDPDTLLDSDPTACSDNNVRGVLENLGISPNRALIVGVTADEVGFLDDPKTASKIRQNQEGFNEISGYNAFFMRDGESVDSTSAPESEASVMLLGARLADSGFVVVSMRDGKGVPVSGIIHSTRLNMPGRNHRNEYGGINQSFMRYTLSKAMAHYGASPESVTIRMAAAIGPEGWEKHFSSREKLETTLPGWADEGLIKNISNEDWQPGDEISRDDAIRPNYPKKVASETTDAAEELGIPLANVIIEGALDPSNPEPGLLHSSENRKRLPKRPKGDRSSRDLYAIITK